MNVAQFLKKRDLALAESNRLPPATVEYLHQLVAQAHNQLYRSERYQFRKWHGVLFRDTPRRIFHDPCVHIAAVLFWGLFLISAYLAYDNSVWPGFAQDVVGQETLDQSADMFASFGGRGQAENWGMFGFYIVDAIRAAGLCDTHLQLGLLGDHLWIHVPPRSR